ncbi:hypothetical protein U9M48_029620 [Paspalum notatum var. saurae]|uniref:DUF569 domain-containing protein n=1 Tax=Paspalum notatum var. saurae TaxID=547442 RepID=A0AAQ3U3Q1_PASNO
MEFFPDRAHVRLFNLVREMYLFADEDGDGVCLSTRREALNTAWLVHRIVRGGVDFVLLHNATNSRYLSSTFLPPAFGNHFNRAVQEIYCHHGQEQVAWLVEGVGDHVVRLRHVTNRFLRATSRYFRWHNLVSIDADHRLSTMMYWEVQSIPLRSERPILPYPSEFPVVGLRTVSYVQAENLEDINLEAMRCFVFSGRSVFQLRYEMAFRLQIYDYLAITLCVRAGMLGRWIPLITDLPRNEGFLTILVLPSASPAALALQYPDVDAL